MRLQPLVLLALGDPGAVCQEQGHDRDHQQPDGAGAEPQDGDRQQRDAGVGHRHQRAELEHVGQLLELRAPDRVMAAAMLTAPIGRGQRGGKAARSRASRRPGGVLDGAEHHHHHHRQQEVVRQVEAQLHRGLARAHHQRGERSDHGRQHVVAGAEEEEADDRRHLGQREGMRLASEVDLDDLDVGQREGDGDQPPGSGTGWPARCHR